MATTPTEETAAPETEPEAAAPPARTRREAVKVAADLATGAQKNGELTEAAAESALEWFMGEEELPVEKVIDVNIGTPDAPRTLAWTITSIGSDKIEQSRKLAQKGGNRASRRLTTQAPEIDEVEANARIVVAGTIDPDLREAARRKGAPNHPDGDLAAVQLLKHRLRGKPGLIDRIAVEILALSGYDDDDIQEHAAGKR
jgi:hypothetical protein